MGFNQFTIKLDRNHLAMFIHCYHGSNSKKVTVLITDGRDGSTASLYEAMAKRFEQSGIRLKVIGVGNVNGKQVKLLVKDDIDVVHGDEIKQFLESDHGFHVNDIC